MPYVDSPGTPLERSTSPVGGRALACVRSCAAICGGPYETAEGPV